MCIFTFYPQPPHSSVKRANNFCFRLNPFPLYILLLIIISQILVRILVSVWVSYQSRREFGTEKSLGTGLEENLVPKKSRNRSRREFGTEKVPEPSRRKFGTEKNPGTGLGQIFGLVTHCLTSTESIISIILSII